MTHPYSVTYHSSFIYFMSELNKQLDCLEKTTFYQLDIKKQDEIKEIFKSFFEYLSKNFETDIFYQNNSTEIKKNITSLFFDDGTKLNFNYLKLKTNRKEIKNKNLGIRVSYNEHETEQTINSKQTESAIRANVIHATDAYFARSVILKFNCLTIHDCFCLSLQDINNCIDFMNNFFLERLFKTLNDEGLELKQLLIYNKYTYSLTIIY